MESPVKSYPLKFQPILVPRAWGGRHLAQRLGRVLPGDQSSKYGESWELADLPDVTSIASNGPLKGKTIREIMKLAPQAYSTPFLSAQSSQQFTSHGSFPLLIKYLDAEENLSVQVHPDQSYEKSYPGSVAKSEAVYILSASPDAVIYRGFRSGVTREQVAAANGTERIVELLEVIPARPDKCYYLPAGTCHAYGAGIFAVEVQTPSTTTFRMYDWGRTSRELHLKEALECVHVEPLEAGRFEKRTHIAGTFSSMSRLCSAPEFTIEKVRMVEDFEQAIPYNRPDIWVILEGAGDIINTPAGINVPFSAGDVLLIPGDMPEARVRIREDASWLDVELPRTLSEVQLA